ACLARGETCKDDCECCDCDNQCYCPFDWFGGKWHPVGCSCAYTNKYVCDHKKEKCKKA
uniref:U11-ctenitoxin-Pn1b n=1 Tax=Phoneutria nigriventer TaxID=6918 RepID=TX90E_PHONI|nr:RecName: Full=U11-ctenitoxin-Pn1b; Short=U11-CNTX-Pn1b; AltName: Full=Venom protein PNTx22C3 [Phoneutria nigriventer]